MPIPFMSEGLKGKSQKLSLELWAKDRSENQPEREVRGGPSDIPRRSSSWPESEACSLSWSGSQQWVPAQLPGTSPSLSLPETPAASSHSSPPARPARFRAEENRPIQVLIPTKGNTSGTSPLDFSTFYSCICTAIFYNAVMQFRHSQTLSPE